MGKTAKLLPQCPNCRNSESRARGLEMEQSRLMVGLAKAEAERDQRSEALGKLAKAWEVFRLSLPDELADLTAHEAVIVWDIYNQILKHIPVKE